MKKFTLGLLMVFGVGMTNFSYAQDDPNQEIIKMYENMYNVANGFGDVTMARTALYHLLMLTSNKSAILDSLGLQYYSSQQWASVALVAKENLKMNPDNELAMELAASAFENLGLSDRALENYEKLLLKTNNTTTLYRMAFLQYNTKKYKEALTSADLLLNRPDISEQKVVFPKQDQSQQEIPMKSAVLNLKGLIAKSQGNTQKAKEYFLEALNSSPQFEMAQINLRDADK